MQKTGIALVLLIVGCNSHPQPPYQGKQGFRFTPPPGWAERDRDNLLPASARKQIDLPLPPLAEGEKLLVRYDRVSAGNLAWVRVTTADLPADASLKEYLEQHSPGPAWQRESAPEDLQVGGSPAARIAFIGRWTEQDYVNESVAIRHGDQVYLIAASFPAGDTSAREQVRKAVAAATWK